MLVCMYDCLLVAGHQSDKGRVPPVDDLEEGRRSQAHKNLSDPVIGLLDT